MKDLLFKEVGYSLSKLIEEIHIGEIALPDIQRPFVWRRTKVRDLFDSMYRGYPVGYLLFWETGATDSYRTIGVGEKQKYPRLLIIDGQQRLTSLYAVLKGTPVLTAKYESERIRIAFNPIEERFEVSNPAIEKDAAWIADISTLWSSGTSLYSFIHDFLAKLKVCRTLSQEEEKKISDAIDKLESLRNYPFRVLEVSKLATEEQVAEIFVRINSKGKPLNQADFVLTLLSVYWEEGRKELEDFSKKAQTPSKEPSPYTPYMKPSPSDLLRVSAAVGFRRAKLADIYAFLRGRDLHTGQFSDAQREKQFDTLKRAQAKVLDLQHWHDFFTVPQRAGYLSARLITSKLVVLQSYALWLIGKLEYQVEPHLLREVMAHWFFMASLTGRYSGSSESQMEQDLALLREVKGAADFVRTLEEQVGAVLTHDYWEVTLPGGLKTSASRSLALSAFYAAQVILGAPVLYSTMKVADFLSPGSKPKRGSLVDRHHLFPRKYLQRHLKIQDRRLTNQTANFTLVEWKDNLRISDRSPREYVPELEARFERKKLDEMYRLHALPERWYEMDYEEFLEERRRRMAQIIREGFDKIGESQAIEALRR